MEEDRQVKETPQKTEPKKKSLLRRILKIFGITVLTLIGLNVLLYILLSIPYIQQKVADFAVNELKSTMNTEVSIDEVRLSLFNNVTLKGIYIEDQSKDTLLYAQDLEVNLSPWEFIKSNKLAITGITVDNFLLNVNQKDSISDFNFQFVIDAFATADTTEVDTAKSSLKIVIEDVNLKRGRLNYDVLSAPQTPGIFNASHISLYDLNTNLDLNSIDADAFDIALNSLVAKEKSGLEIKSLKGHLFSDKDQLWVEDLSLNLPNSHLIARKVEYNLANDNFLITTEDAEIAAKDLVAVMPELKFLRNNISLKARISGSLPSVSVETINLTYGDDCVLEGSASIANYERYGNSDISLSIDRFRISQAAIVDFAKLGDSTFVSPDILKEMGDIFLKGKMAGQLNKFKLDAEAWARPGALTLAAIGGVDTTFTNFNVNAGLQTQNFNLGKLLGEDTGLGGLTAHVNLKAKQSGQNDLIAEAQGAVEALHYEESTIKNIPFDAFYNAVKMGLTAKADWSIGKIFVKADMTQEKDPDINIRLRVDTLQLDPFYKNENWSNPRLTMALNGSLKGLDIDNITGKVSIDTLDLHDDNFTFKPGAFVLEAGRNESSDKFITFTSSLVTANITGQYSFMSITDEFSDIMNGYLPAVFDMKTNSKKQAQNNFTFTINAKNTEEAGRVFMLPVDLIAPASVKGQVNTIEKQITVNGDIPHMRYGDMNIRNTKIDIANHDSAFNILAASSLLMEKGTYKLSLKVDGENDIMHSLLNIKSDSTGVNVNGAVEAIAQFERNEKNELVSTLNVTPSDIMVDKLALNLLPAKVINAGNRTEIQDVGIGVNKKKYFGIDGVISENRSDTLNVYFSHAEIGDILEAFEVDNIRGSIHGNIALTNILDQPELYTDGFSINDIIIFGDTLGTMNLDSHWSNEYGGVTMLASLAKEDETYAEIDGTVYTRQDSLDLQLRMSEMPLKWMQPFASEFLNKMDGSISSNLIIEGRTSAPQIRGFLGFNNAQLGIDYTNVTYTISDTIRVSPDKIGFDNLTLKDNQGNTAKVSATVTHKNFEDMKYSLNMQMNKLMVLNTEHRTDSLFYGRVFASGTVRITGDDNGIDMNMQVKNDKNSNLNILLPQHAEATDYKSVVYINVPEEKLKNSLKDVLAKKEEPLPLNLNVRLEVNDDLNIGIVIDPSTGDALQKVKGKGTINFSYNMSNDNMSVFGDYAISSGNVKLNLQNIKRLDFAIRDGSKLDFIGDPMKTRFNITAFRRVRASLETLDASFAMDNTSSKVNVDCVLGIVGNMDNMELTYNISLPEVSDDVQQKVNSYIVTDEQKIKQFASLIAINSFYPSTGTSGANFGEGIWTNMAAGAMSTVLSSMVGNMLGDKWQIGASVESNDGTLSDLDMQVNVSRKFWDDKLTFKTDLGYRTDQSNVDNSFIGNFDLEYQINYLWTLRAYSHTNDKYYRQAPTTQGVGIVYNKEASTLKRLFQSFKPRRFRRNQDQQTQGQQNNTSRSNEQQVSTQNRRSEDEKTLPVQPSDSTQTTIVKQPVINDEKDK